MADPVGVGAEAADLARAKHHKFDEEEGMSRKPASSAVGRLGGAVAAALLVLAAPSGVSATPRDGVPTIGVTIDVSSRDCQTVTIGYRIDWQSMTPDSSADPVTIELQATPGSYFLTSAVVDFGHKSDKAKGKARGELIRESGYFDHQTYPGLEYQVEVRGGSDILARSNTVTMANCVPMSPVTGPAAGGTVVTVVGGGTFGGPLFTTDSRVTVGDVSEISPIAVAPDGRWLQFVTPPGPADSCVTVFTDNPGLSFPLPPFCYGA